MPKGMRRAPFKKMKSAGKRSVAKGGRSGFNNVARPKSRVKKR